MKPIKCQLLCNNRWGYCATPMDFPSIRKAVEYGRNSPWFAYRVVVNGKVVRRGFGDFM